MAVFFDLARVLLISTQSLCVAFYLIIASISCYLIVSMVRCGDQCFPMTIPACGLLLTSLLFIIFSVMFIIFAVRSKHDAIRLVPVGDVLIGLVALVMAVFFLWNALSILNPFIGFGVVDGMSENMQTTMHGIYQANDTKALKVIESYLRCCGIRKGKEDYTQHGIQPSLSCDTTPVNCVSKMESVISHNRVLFGNFLLLLTVAYWSVLLFVAVKAMPNVAIIKLYPENTPTETLVDMVGNNRMDKKPIEESAEKLTPKSHEPPV